MTDPLLDYHNDLPVELSAPDITEYRESNSGVEYIHTMDSGKSGPHVLISAVVHGNELWGAIAADWLLQQAVKPVAGRLSVGFMNVEAYLSYDADHPNRSRWVDEDFNRLWGPGVLADPKRTVTSEVRRARSVQPFLDTVDLLLDIHSMQQPCVPLMMAGMVAKGRHLAAQVGIPSAVITDSGHTEGMRMRDYAAFRDPDSARNALLIECGQHWERATGNVAKATMVRFLRASKIVENDFGHELLKTIRQAPVQAFYEVGETVTVESDAFIFDQPCEGFEHLPKDTLIGRDGSRLITAPFDTTVLIMPSKRLHPGKTAVRLAHPISP